MDNDSIKVFITKIQITKENTAEQAVEICDRLIRWLNDNLLPEVDLCTVLDSLDVILYAVFTVEAYWQMHRSRMTDLLPQNPLDFFIRKLLSTRNGGQLLPIIVHHYFKKYISESRLHAILKNDIPLVPLQAKFAEDRNKPINELVERIFRLKEEHVSTAIDRLVDSLPFKEIVEIFSVKTKKYLILQNEICNRMMNPKFINSIFTTCANELELFYKILLDRKFNAAIINYFLSVLIELKDFDDEQMPESNEDFNFKEISFLMGALLHNNSPARIQFYQAINQEEINSNLIRYLSRMQLIYDY
ncbi:hypothetical protein ACFFRR_001546 [Megaselia abdita]